MKVSLRKRKRKKRVSLFLDYMLNGERQNEYLGIFYNPGDKDEKKQKLKLADSIRARRELELNNSEYGFIPTFKRKQNFVEYFRKITAEKNDKAWRHTLLHLTNYTGGQLQFGSVTEEWLETFKVYLQTTAGLKKNSAGAYFAKIKACLNHAVRDKIIPHSPAVTVRQIPKAPVHKVFLDVDEVEKMAQAPCGNPHIKLAFLFSCYTGLRISDIKRLEWQHIHGDRLEIIQKKTGESLYLDLCDMAQEILKAVKRGTAPFPTLKVFSDLPSDVSTNRCLKRMAKNAGIHKNISFHTGRHTMATMGLTMGVDIYTVSKLLGHTDIKTTQIYAKIVDRKMKEAVQKLPKFRILS